MINKYSFNLRYISFALFAIIFPMLLFSCCEDSNTSPEQNKNGVSFPEFFIEKGSDSDTTYISLRGIKKNNDTLEIQATGWGIIEYGLFLSRHNLPKEIHYQLMGECGTVSSRTWAKVTLAQWI